MSMREKIAATMLDRLGIAMPMGRKLAWEEIEEWRKKILLADADAVLDLLTAPPTEAMIAAGNDAMPLDPSYGASGIWEAMVRAMIDEGKPKPVPTWDTEHSCKKDPDCIMPDGHSGPCSDIPF